MNTDKKCAHPACSCPALEHDNYCSDYCKEAKDMPEITCQCPHVSCQGEALRV